MSTAHISNPPLTSAPTNGNASPRPTIAQVALGIFICMLAAGVASAFTFSGLKEWYPSLIKPPRITPPNEVFGPVWTVLYILMGISLAYMWAVKPEKAGLVWAMRWFWIQLALNVGWCAAFFGLHSPSWGYVIICLLWMAIVGFFWTASKLSRAAVLLMVPYFLWVTFASCLNFGFLQYNVLKPKVEAMDRDPRNQDSRYLLTKPDPKATPVQID